jgi:hypothetical protein
MVTTHRRVVARYLDGRLVKGYTFDFGPAQPRFHIFAEPSASGAATQVFLRDLKALFFVRDLAGDPARQDGRPPRRGGAAREYVEVRFRDGELMVGTIEGPADDPPGFFLVPADPGTNNLRVYVLTAATRAVYPLPGPARPSADPASVPGRPRATTTPAQSPLPVRLVSWLTR